MISDTSEVFERCLKCSGTKIGFSMRNLQTLNKYCGNIKDML